jgi:hypothetical protein
LSALLCSADLQALTDSSQPFYNHGAKVTVVHGREQPNLWKSRTAATTQVDIPQPSFCDYELSKLNSEVVSSRRARIDAIESPAAFSGSAIELVTKALLSKPTVSEFSFSASDAQRRVPKSSAAAAAAAAAAQHRDRGVDAPYYRNGGGCGASANNEHPGHHYSRDFGQHQYSYLGQLQPSAYPSHPLVTGAQLDASSTAGLGLRITGNDTNATGVLTEAALNSFGEFKARK